MSRGAAMHWESIDRERAVRLAVTATASRPAGRGQGWTVEAGHWRAEGRTEKDTVDVLAGNLTAFLAAYQPPLIVTFRGYTAVVSLTRGDSDGGNPVTWQQRTVYPGRLRHLGLRYEHRRLGGSRGERPA